MTFQGVDRVIDAIYSERAGYVLLLLEDSLLRFDPDAGAIATIALPGPPLSIAEFEGTVVVGFDDAIVQVDLPTLTLGRRLRTPVPARELAIGSSRISLVTKYQDEDGLLVLSLDESVAARFFPYGLDAGTLVRQGPEGLVAFNKHRSFYQFAFEESSGDINEVCWRSSEASGDKIWLHGTDVFMEDGSRLQLDMAGCKDGDESQETRAPYKTGGIHRGPTGTVRSFVKLDDYSFKKKSFGPKFVTRLPVVEILALCAQQDYIALIQHPRLGHMYRELSAGEARAPEAGIHVEVFSNPLPKRLAALPLPPLQGREMAAWGRYVFCDDSSRLFVILKQGTWTGRAEGWGITTIDLNHLEHTIARSRKWAELIQ